MWQDPAKRLLSLIFKGIQTTKRRNQYFSIDVAFIKWRFLCTKFGAETTQLWACANQVESMNGLFLEQDCFGQNQVTLQCILILQHRSIAFVIIKAVVKFNCIFFEENLQQEKDRRGNWVFVQEIHKLKRFSSIQYLAIQGKNQIISWQSSTFWTQKCFQLSLVSPENNVRQAHNLKPHG